MLINNSLSNISLYMLFLYFVLSTILKRMDRYRKRLLWNGGSNIKKYHLVNWDAVCTPKNQGGLGILDLRCMNNSLLAKWLWKLEKHDDLWQSIVRKNTLRRNL